MKKVLLYLSVCALLSSVFPEGSKELHPKSNQSGPYLQIWDTPNQVTRKSATYDPDSNYRLNIKICNLGEKVYFGIQQTDNDVYFRIMDPLGKSIPINGLIDQDPAAAGYAYRLPNSGNGYINNLSESWAGPKPFSASGYDPLSFVPQLTGDYYVQFNQGSPTVLNRTWRKITYFDFTVVDTTNNNTIKKGRLWSKAWDIQCNSGSNTFDSQVYVYSRDSVVTKIDFNGMQPYGFVISCNSSGCTNTGNVVSDRMSRVGNVTYPEYKLFLNDPDPQCYPNKVDCGAIIGDPTIVGCDPNNRCIQLNVTKAGNVEILLDFELPKGYNGVNSKDIILKSKVQAGINCIKWDSKDAKGNIISVGTAFDISINYFNGLTHLPLYDVENHLNGYAVTLVRPSGGSCGTTPKIFWDDSNIIAGTALDTKVELNGVLQGHKWKNRGDNNCGGGAQFCPETINTWWYGSATERTVTYQDLSIVVDANKLTPGFGSPANDTSVCSNIGEVPLHGRVSGFTNTGIWSIVKGSGAIKLNPTTLENIYVPGTSDRIPNNFVTLKLSATNTGVCNQVSDTLRIYFTQGPSIKINNAPSIDICQNNPSADLTATKNNTVSSFQWFGGAGTFIPNRNTLNITYKPSQAELDAGSDVKLVLRSTTQAGCSPASDSVIVKFIAPPVVQVANAINVCKNNPYTVSLGGFSSTGAGIWSGGIASHFSPSVNNTNATYAISQQEANAGNPIVLTLTSSNNARCNAVSAKTTINFFSPPVANAGSNIVVCTNKSDVLLSATTSSNRGKWRSLSVAGVFIPNDSTLNAIFRPSVNVVNAAQPFLLEFSGLSNGNGCAVVKDTISVSFKNSPIVNAGLNKDICKNVSSISLSGATSSTGSGNWVGGNGVFSNRNDLSSIYQPTESEKSFGFVILELHSTNNGICNPAIDTITINFFDPPTVSLGQDVSVCKNNNIVTINNANATLYETVQWSANVAGVFNPSATSDDFANVKFVPTGTQGPFKIKLKVFNNTLGCAPVEDEFVVNYINEPIVNAGPDINVCKNNVSIQLKGSSSTGSATWSGGISANYSNKNSLTTNYTPTQGEINSGSIEFTLTSSQNGTCNPVVDKVLVTFINPPSVDAGVDKTVCANNANAVLLATTSTLKGAWSGGSGTFVPRNDTTSVTYVPSIAEKNAAPNTVKLFFTSINTDNCKPVKDSLLVNITSSPISDAGADLTQCKNNINVLLSGKVTQAGGGKWTGGQGSFSPNPTTANVAYIPSQNEINKGFVVLKWTTTNNGICNQVTDSTKVSFTPSPTVDAGSDIYVCESTNTVTLQGKVTNAASGKWTTLSGTTVANTVNANYNLTTQDKTNGFVTLVLETTGVGNCLPLQDTLNIFITKISKVNAGPDKETCITDAPVELNAIGNSGKWVIVFGAGTFSNPNSLKTFFTPAQSSVGTTIVLSYINDPLGACGSVSDDVNVKVLDGPKVMVGSDLNICGSNRQITISGNISGSTSTGVWYSTNAQGVITSPNATTTNYTLTEKESKNATSLLFVLQTTNNQICSAQKDTLKVNITPSPIISAGPDMITCESNPITLIATVLNGTINSWASIGGGIFNPSNQLSTQFVPSNTEINSGAATVVATSNASGACPAVRDTVVIAIKKMPTVTVPADFKVCGDTSGFSLVATASTNAGTWSTNGNGILAIDPANPLKVNYQISVEEQDNGANLTFTFTSSNNEVCPGLGKNTIVTIMPRPKVSVLDRDTVCNDGSVLNLSINTTHISGVVWSSSGDGTFGNATGLNTTYILGPNDKKSSQFVIINTSKGDATCKPLVVNKSVSVVAKPEVFAGNDREICSNFTGVISLIGTSKNTISTEWTNLGATGTYNAKDKLVSDYTVTQADLAKQSFQIALKGIGSPKCKVVFDTLEVKVLSKPSAGADSTITICESASNIHFMGNSSTGTGMWTAAGTAAIFSPKPDTNSVVYTITNQDRNNGGFTVFFNTTNNKSCTPNQSKRIVILQKSPTLDIAPSFEVCETATEVGLSSAVTIAGGVTWKTSGTGNFDNQNSLTPKYFPSALDKKSGKVVITANSTQNGVCPSVSDQAVLNITPMSTISGPGIITICNEIDSAKIELTTSNTNGVIWTGGQGAFQSVSNDTTIYYPAISELNSAPINVLLTASTIPMGSCASINKNVSIKILAKPIVDAGNPILMCGDQNSVFLQSTFSNANGIVWSKLSGAGSVLNPTSASNAAYQPTAIEKDNGFKALMQVKTTGNGICSPVIDTVSVTITPKPMIKDIGDNIQVCEDNTDGVGLGFPTLIGASKAIWSTSGGGNIIQNGTPNSSYFITPEDIASGLVTFKITTDPENTKCKAISASKSLTFVKKPFVDAGPDRTVCIGASAITLNGTVLNASGGVWSSDNDGVFVDPSQLNSVYNFNTKTQTHLVLTPVGVGVCNIAPDTLVLDFISDPKINAGPDSTFCTSNLPIKLRAFGAEGTWQLISGPSTGAFMPDNSALNATFVPSTLDVGKYTFRITTNTFGGDCPSYFDDVDISVIDGPTVSLPPNITICESQTSIDIVANTSNVGSATTKWSAVGSGVFISQNSASTTYQISENDINIGKVVIQFATEKSVCPMVNDTMSLFIQKRPQIAISEDQEVCESIASINVGAQMEGANSVIWKNISTNNNGFDNPSSLSPNYSFSNGDKQLDSVLIQVETVGNGKCGVAFDTLSVQFEKLKSINAPNDTSICYETTSIGLHAISSNVKSVLWVSSGKGKFDPDPSSQSVGYSIPDTDKIPQPIKFIVTSQDQSLCPEVRDSMFLTIIPQPLIEVDTDFVKVCDEAKQIDLSSKVTNVSKIAWLSSGTGSFVDNLALSTQYVLSSQDKEKGGISFVVTSDNNDGCKEVSKSITVQLVPRPVSLVNAGFDQTVCKDNDSVNLIGFVTQSGGGKWTVIGNSSPNFFPNDTSMLAKFIPTVSELNNGAKVVLTSIVPSICGVISDTIQINFTPVPVVNIASPVSAITICADSQRVDLEGAFAVAKSAQWSTSGKGVFVKSEFDNNTSYFPHPDDINVGKILITYTGKDIGTCKGVYFDTLAVNYTPLPVISGSDEDVVCENNPSYNLNFNVQNEYAGHVNHWESSSGLGIFSPNSNEVNAVFTPDPLDIKKGEIMLTFKSSNNGTCKTVSKNFKLKFTGKPIIAAGLDRVLCESNANVSLLGKVTGGASQAIWQTTGSGAFIPSSTALNATYIPSPFDIQSKGVKLILVSTDNTSGLCVPEKDTLKVDFTNAPILSATAKSLCTFDKGLELVGQISGSPNFSASWSSNGKGTFAPSKFVNSVQYIPADEDKISQLLHIVYKTQNVGNCAKDSIVIPVFITPLPVADAGDDQFVCKGFKDTINIENQSDYRFDWKEIGTSYTLQNTTELITPEIVKKSHDFQLTVTDAKGCVSYDTVRVMPIDNPGMSILPKICLKQDLVIAPKSNNADPRANYQWYRNGVAISNGVDSLLRVNQAGLYTVQYTLGNCNIYKTSTRILQNPVIFTEDGLYCKNDTANVTVKRVFKSLNTYNWVFNGGVAPEKDSIIKRAVVADTNKFVVTATNFDGCKTMDSAYALTIPRPKMTLSPNMPGCEGRSIILNANPDKVYPEAVRVWTYNGDTLSDKGPILNVTQTKYGEGTYIVTYTLDNCVSMDTSIVKFYALPVSQTFNRKFCSLTESPLTVNIDPNGLAAFVRWVTPINKMLNTSDTSRILKLDSIDMGGVTEKHFIYEISNSIGCKVVDSLIVKDFCTPEIFVPTGFTPNGDGNNDKFGVYGLAKYFDKYQLYVFNRWGEVIYKTHNFYDVWDGNYREEQMPVGVYPYVITYEYKDPEKSGRREQNGKVTIIR